ncbi:hypothetical protein [Qaidamihabitans albus]|uniref:hypothetical protein n=1 Tax=Qaidamihabitans albus TaxID=2795733 RepID=UPI001F37F94A|nr:hypothetical protein [Qaidamihabitans albus]
MANEIERLKATYVDRARSIQGIQSEMESAWTGDAGAAASEGAGPLMQALEESAMNMDATTGATMSQSGAWHDASNSVEPVPPMPEKPNPWTTGLKAAIPVAGPFMAADDLNSYQDAAEAHNKASQHNVDVMNGYASQTNGNSNFPRTYGVLEPGGASISVNSSTPSAISGETSSVPETTSASRFAGSAPVTGGSPGSPVGAGPNVGSPIATGAGPAPGPVSAGPSVSSGPTTAGPGNAPAPGTPTGAAAATNVPPAAGAASTNRTNQPRTGFGRPPSGTGSQRPTSGAARGGTASGPGSSRGGSGFGERAGSRLYGQGAAGRGAAAGEGAGGRVPADGARGLGGAKGTGAGLPGGAAAADSAAARGGGAAGGARGAGGMAPMGAGAGKGKGSDDDEHQRASYLQENDPDEVFIGKLDRTTPPVIGE